jgi:hypothetical protein
LAGAAFTFGEINGLDGCAQRDGHARPDQIDGEQVAAGFAGGQGRHLHAD